MFENIPTVRFGEIHSELLHVLWEMARFWIITMTIFLPIQIYCCKKKRVKKRKAAPKEPQTPEIHTTTNATAPLPNQAVLPVAPQSTPPIKEEQKKILGKGKPTTTKEKTKEKNIEDKTQTDHSDDSNDEKPDVIPMDKVEKLGNIDEMLKARKEEMDKEIEQMKSIHEMDDNKPMQTVINPNVHVKIDEKKCKLYETNDQPTIDEEVNEQLI